MVVGTREEVVAGAGVGDSASGMIEGLEGGETMGVM